MSLHRPVGPVIGCLHRIHCGTTRWLAIMLLAVGLTTLNACTVPANPGADTGISAGDITPRIGGDESVVNKVSALERSHLQLIATNLVSTMVQIPGMQPSIRTLQVNNPQTAFGSAIIRALEEAGYGLQRVSADQGQRYVSYSKRLSETESGLVTDYSLAVGKIQLSREYTVNKSAIYPSSLMKISGAQSTENIVLTDEIFTEQGGDGEAFISGVQASDQPDANLDVKTVGVNDYDEIPAEKRMTPSAVFAQAERHFFKSTAQRAIPDLNLLDKYRRTVLIFNNSTTRFLGTGNKRAVRLLAREFESSDLMLIRACQDADGVNESAFDRAIRVQQELAGFGVPDESTYIAPCARTSYRHSSDDSPTPVEVILYRPKP